MCSSMKHLLIAAADSLEELSGGRTEEGWSVMQKLGLKTVAPWRNCMEKMALSGSLGTPKWLPWKINGFLKHA